MSHNEAGQSLIEVIVVAVAGILVVAALTFATIFSLRNANFAKTSAQATKLAQEGIEWVRTGRDRSSNISNTTFTVNSWNGDEAGAGAIWNYQLSNECATGPYCYFKVNDQGQLNFVDMASTMPLGAESIPPNFKRAVILSDDSSWPTEKIVTVIVTWKDATGEHESRLTTILGKL